jgi:ATP-dependent RNA helicase RhlE
VFGGTAIDPQIATLKNGVDILIATPGRLLDLRKQELINLSFIETLVLDEADLMLDMGFIDDIKKIERLCPKDKQTALFSATMPEKVVQLAQTILKNRCTRHKPSIVLCAQNKKNGIVPPFIKEHHKR